MGTPIQPGDLTFKTREYYLNGGSDSAKGSTLTFQELDTTLIFLSNSIANVEGGPGTPAGPNQSIQFNSGSNFSGSSNFTFDYNNNVVNLTGSLIATSFTGSLQGTTSWAYSASQAISASYAFSSSYASVSSLSDRTTQIDVYVLNNSGYNIAKGVVVRISGSNNSSDTPRIVTASYENDNNSANTLGITTTAINDGANGYVITEGILTGIDTNNFISGQLIYLGATGSIIGSAPVAPLHAVRLGEVIRSQQINGSIYVRIDNGYEIEELHDVKITSPTTGDLLIRSSSVWINSKQLTGSYELTGSLAVSNSLNVVGTGSVSGSFIVSGSLVINPNGVGSQLINSFLLGRTSSAFNMQTNGTFALGTGGSGGGGNGGFSYDAGSFPNFVFRNPGGDAGLTIKTNIGTQAVTTQAIIFPNTTANVGIALGGHPTAYNHLVIVSASHGSASIGIGTASPLLSHALTVTGSVAISNVLTLIPQDPLPSGVATGSFAVSSSVPAKPYFWDGSTWQALY